MKKTDALNTNGPDWANYCIGYQCFIDSFAKTEDAQVTDQTKVYNQQAYQLDWEARDQDYHYGRGFYGGNLKGIDKVAQTYLSDLGITMLYLTPIFKAESNHKYDTLDYQTIDPQFGTLDDFKQLINTCNQHEIKVILDGVFNHVSSNHPWHQEAITGNEDFLNRFKRNKEGFIMHWEGVQTMPLLNHHHPEVKKYFYTGPDSIINEWIKLGASGWRLDVAERLGKQVIRAINHNLKQYHPQALLIGEVVETYGTPWLQDGLLDGLMNYVFRGVTVKFLQKTIDAKQYLAELDQMVQQYPYEKLLKSWNILSTHDTNRMLYDVGGDESFFKMAVVAQFTYPGMPMIYYGDEIGMQSGKKEISNRMGMDWESVRIGKQYGAWNGDPMAWEITRRYNSYHEFYKYMIWIRKNNPVFIEGNFIPVEISESCLAYFRVNDKQNALIIINRDSNQDIVIDVPTSIELKSASFRCLYGQDGHIHVKHGKIKFYAHGRNAYIFVN